MLWEILFSLADSTLRVATPLLLATFAGLLAERAGIVDIGLEGKMLASAFASASIAFIASSPLIGLAAGILAALLLSAGQAVVAVRYKGNQLIVGMAINILIAGLSPLLALAWFQQGGRTPILDAGSRFNEIVLPGVDLLNPLPIIGPLYRNVISGHSGLTYATLLMVIVVSGVLRYTYFGLKLRAVGDNPYAVDAAGISVARTRYTALLWNGVLCGIAGTYLAVFQTGGFIPHMTAGKGFLALAALVFGKWRPGLAAFGCLLFAGADALQIRLEGSTLPGIGRIPTEFMMMVPYLLTIFLLAGFLGRAVPPKALGLPFVKTRE